MKLLPSLFQVGGPALTHPHDATSYLLQTQDGPLLMDCGTPSGYELLLRNLNTLDVNPKQLLGIYGTHGHYDHVGAAALFRRDFGTKLFLHPADKSAVEQGDPLATTAELLYGKSFPPCPVTACLQEGDLIAHAPYLVSVLHTPGHTPGSVCFEIAAPDWVLLIAGDTLFGGFSPHIHSNEEDWRNSLATLRARHYDMMTFGHCPPQLLADANTRIRSASDSFATYYNPWFKDFKKTYPY